MGEIHFDWIDSKDGYGILGTDRQAIAQENKHNRNVLFSAKMEYLEELDKLQKKIRAKYEPQLDNTILDETVEDDFHNDSWQDMMKFGHLYYT